VGELQLRQPGTKSVPLSFAEHRLLALPGTAETTHRMGRDRKPGSTAPRLIPSHNRNKSKQLKLTDDPEQLGRHTTGVRANGTDQDPRFLDHRKSG